MNCPYGQVSGTRMKIVVKGLCALSVFDSITGENVWDHVSRLGDIVTFETSGDAKIKVEAGNPLCQFCKMELDPRQATIFEGKLCCQTCLKSRSEK